MKKVISAILALILTMLLAGCGGETVSPEEPPAPIVSEVIKGPSEVILAEIKDIASGLLSEENPLPETADSPLTAENIIGILGLDSSAFGKYIEEGTVSAADDSSIPFEIIVIKCVDSSAAATIAQTLTQSYNGDKWIYSSPDQAFTAVSGSYVLLAACSYPHTDAIYNAFSAISQDTSSEKNVFYDSVGGDSVSE